MFRAVERATTGGRTNVKGSRPVVDKEDDGPGGAAPAHNDNALRENRAGVGADRPAGPRTGEE